MIVQALDDDFSTPSIARQWDQFVPPGNLGLTYRFLTCSRALQMSGFRLVPLLLSNPAGRTLGVASSYLNSIDGADLGKGSIQRAVALVRRLFPRFLKYQVIEIGLPSTVGFPSCGGTPGRDPIEALATWAMTQAKRQPNSLVVVRDIDEAVAPKAVATLRRLGFQPTPLPPTFLLSLPFRSFDEYASQMRSAYRRRLTKHLKATSSLRCEVVRDFTLMAPELIGLWRNLYDRVTRYRRVVVTQAFLEAVSDLDESRVLLLRRLDDTIAGFGLLYIDGPVLRYSSTGFTREAARDEGVYFRMLYEVVRFAIENGCEAVSLGQSTAEPKMNVGGMPVILQAWIWHRSSLKRRALSWLTRTLMQPPAPPERRNVFRSDLPRYADPALAEEGPCVTTPLAEHGAISGSHGLVGPDARSVFAASVNDWPPPRGPIVTRAAVSCCGRPVADDRHSAPGVLHGAPA